MGIFATVAGWLGRSSPGDPAGVENAAAADPGAVRSAGDPAAVRSLNNPAIPMSQAVEWLLEAFGAGEDLSGQRVSPKTAQTMSAVYACLRLISETAGSLPVGVYKRLGRGEHERAEGHAVEKLLDAPCEALTGQIFRETLFKAHLLYGEAYAEIRRDPATGEIAELWPLNPGATHPALDGRRLWFRTSDEAGNRRTLFPSEILHVPLLPDPGEIAGNAPPANARTAIGLGLAAEAHDAKFYGQGGLGPLKIELPSRWDDESFNRFKLQVEAARKAGGGVLVFEANTKAEPLPQDFAAFMERRRFQVLELSRFYGVPPHMIGESEKGAPKSSVEEQEREFAKHTLRPILRRFEAEYNRKLFGAERGRFVVLHDLTELLQADTRTTWLAFSIARQMGIYNVNEIRRKLGEPGIGPAGDQYLSPVNLDVIPRALERGLDGEIRSAVAELERTERRTLLDGLEEGELAGLADRAERFYRVDLRRAIAAAVAEAGRRFAGDFLGPLGIGSGGEGFTKWADRLAGRHCDRALGTLRTDPLGWIAGGRLEWDPRDALVALTGGNGHADHVES